MNPSDFMIIVKDGFLIESIYLEGFYFGKPMTTENVGCLIESNFRACIKAH